MYGGPMDQNVVLLKMSYILFSLFFLLFLFCKVVFSDTLSFIGSVVFSEMLCFLECGFFYIVLFDVLCIL